MKPPKMIEMKFLNLPGIDDEHFQNLVKPPRPTTTPYGSANLQFDDQEQPHENTTKRHAPYVSFGDQGTTASAGIYGSLLRICRPMKSSRLHSGMISLGLPDNPQAWYVYWRTSRFLESAQTLNAGFGLRVLNLLSSEPPTVNFLADRWPVISYKSVDNFTINVKLWCHDNVIVQHMEITGRSISTDPLKLEFNPNFSMQDLDFLEKREDLQMQCLRGPHGYGIIDIEDAAGFDMTQERICVLVGLFKDGNAQELEGNKPILIEHDFNKQFKVEVTAAFKLQMITLKEDWKRCLISSDDLKFVPPEAPALETSSFSDPDLGWYLRRNLEHILSVCSIPFQKNASSDSKTLIPAPMITLNAPGGKEDVLHRSVPANKRLGPLRQRIHEVCRGHLECILSLDADDACSSNIHINGKRMENSEETDLPPDSPTNIPIHIIKATEYVKVFSDIDDLLFVCSMLGRFTLGWFEQLIDTRNHISPTWQHLSDSEIPIYRLSDHVWIWKALRNIEDLTQRVEATEKESPHDTLKTFLDIKKHLSHQGPRKSTLEPRLNFTSEDLRRQNLRRFTLENDIMKKRMLSVTRTARETRFLLHSRDTILYYGLEWGFFEGEETVWKHLIKAQVQHDEASNDETQWDNPLRYGLAIEMAKQGHQLESEFTPPEMFIHAQKIILNSSSENGLFPGQLDSFSKEPVLFDREIFRDFYFHVGFEIPFILLRTMRGEKVAYFSSGEASKTGERSFEGEMPSLKRTIDLSPISGINPGATQDYFSFQNRTLAIQRTLKRQNPYGRLVDLSNIVELPEEWLYKYPDFLDFTPPKDRQKLRQIQAEAPLAIQETMRNYYLRQAMNPFTLHPIGRCFATVDDVRKGKKQRKWSVDEKCVQGVYDSYKGLWERLQQQRSAEESKKRLIYLRAADYIVSTMCYIASPELERVHMAQFFDRHAKLHANYFYDDTSAVVNNWVTEVHFRFFQFYKPVDGEAPAQAPTHVRQLKSQICGIFGNDAYLVDAVISFRIVGDFFDRYWTSHVLQNFADPTELANYPPLDEYDRSHDTHWQQRKVLELILLNHILAKVCSSTGIILRRIEQGPRLTASDAGEKYFSKDSFEDRKPGELRESFQVLVILKNNINSLQGLTEQFNGRESSQGRERPRWTREDEQKYRKAIKQKQAHFEDHVREIKATAARIEFLIALVTSAQDAIRSKKALRESENVTLFTYVTVFFLPVGLAVSIFSMSNAPDRNLLVYMIVTALVAVIITVGVLWCVLGHLIPTCVDRIMFIIHACRGSSDTEDEVLREQTNHRVFRQLSFGPKDNQKFGRILHDLEGQTGHNGETNSVRKSSDSKI
ncbi:hypothetical protein N7495_002702 [Penicillium taxi]|uniref:uncharacterized protein n=1 Tax=Penicillium taxi TaxID=168475 RepID=UPI0025450B28|nr:uncharacterized protein N7495_002702 [Penicillium taxi]KAJ5902174.1 hypothetical protein N7495_002702 [Penicillium taxi]